MAEDKKIEIKDTITPKVSYAGAVKVEYYKNGKKITIEKHNNGKQALFTGICRYLAGYPAKEYRPTKLMGYHKDESESSEELLFVDPIPYTTTPLLLTEDGYQSPGDCKKIQYGFLIPRNAITDREKPMNILRLLTDDGTHCAEIILESGEEISLDIASNILVYWTMEISNETEMIGD